MLSGEFLSLISRIPSILTHPNPGLLPATFKYPQALRGARPIVKSGQIIRDCQLAKHAVEKSPFDGAPNCRVQGNSGGLHVRSLCFQTFRNMVHLIQDLTKVLVPRQQGRRENLLDSIFRNMFRVITLRFLDLLLMLAGCMQRIDVS